jgi:murein DD-endopeptidase MepM/ murein hydrolase activator NlpD
MSPVTNLWSPAHEFGPGTGADRQKLLPSPASGRIVPAPEAAWSTVTVLPGENLSLIFKRENLSAKTLDLIMDSGPEAALLAKLRPGQKIQYRLADGMLTALRLEPSHWETLEVRRVGEAFHAEMIKASVVTHVQKVTGIITDSLFMSGQRAGLSDPLIMELISIYAWDVDFALEVRVGDSFKVLYEEYFRDGKRVRVGPILAAEFVNQGKRYPAVRYTSTDGHNDYYSDTGLAMRKAFLRTPLNFTRISSSFSLGRRHPILNTIRAHRGVDYAAPLGTPIKAAGDGTVVYMGTKGGYGRTVILRHGSTYSTLYAHMSRYAGTLKRGERIQQGKIIGYVGMSGLATGPHLHYEFQVAGVHRNPLTVDLPKADAISANQWDRFQQQAVPLLAQLELPAPARESIIAMGDTGTEGPVVH